MLSEKPLNKLLEDRKVGKLFHNDRNDSKIVQGYDPRVWKRQMAVNPLQDLKLHLSSSVFFRLEQQIQ